MTNFSIIIPHKNNLELLQRCLNSIPVRDDVEIIIIDDNSDPQITDFNKFPIDKFHNTSIIYTNDAKGCGYARNVGIKQAKGVWAIFSDCDDEFFTENLNSLMNQATESKYDIICWPVLEQCFDGSERQYPIRFAEKYGTIINQEGNVHLKDSDIEGIEYRLYESWHKMVRLSVINNNNLSYSEIPICEDIFFTEKLASITNNVGIWPKYIYKYIRRSNSLSYMSSNLKFRVRITEFFRVYAFLKKIGKTHFLEDIDHQIYTLSQKSLISIYILSFKRMYFVSFVDGFKTLVFAQKETYFHIKSKFARLLKK